VLSRFAAEAAAEAAAGAAAAATAAATEAATAAASASAVSAPPHVRVIMVDFTGQRQIAEAAA
jgi:hypothetical protein